MRTPGWCLVFCHFLAFLKQMRQTHSTSSFSTLFWHFICICRTRWDISALLCMPDTLGLSTFKSLQRPQRAGQVHIAGIPEEDLSGQIHRGDFKRLAPIVMKKRRVSSHIAVLNYLDGTHDCLCNQKKQCRATSLHSRKLLQQLLFALLSFSMPKYSVSRISL